MNYADLQLTPLRGEYKGITCNEIIMNKKWDDLVARAYRKRTAEQEARKLRAEAIDRAVNAELLRKHQLEAARKFAEEKARKEAQKKITKAFDKTAKCLVLMEKKALQRVVK